MFARGLMRNSLLSNVNRSIPRRGIDEFVSPQFLKDGNVEGVGRSWKPSEIRNKSMTDLQRLWIKCMKERNMLNTIKHFYEKQGGRMPHIDRVEKNRVTMERIATVVRERHTKAKKLAQEEFERRKAANRYKPSRNYKLSKSAIKNSHK
eukprot:gb/GECH01014296.1/.p1 GENE.gb/GECH01014296.1/~~gb/GECH01014296.1/.p1  ORF type:complete len:149 (+),score=32.60 gb/GECH01014296.1/:1-447(+)